MTIFLFCLLNIEKEATAPSAIIILVYNNCEMKRNKSYYTLCYLLVGVSRRLASVAIHGCYGDINVAMLLIFKDKESV